MSVQSFTSNRRRKYTHIFDKEKDFHYVEPEWCSQQLFEVEQSPGSIYDPFAGRGRVVKAAQDTGYVTSVTEIVDRGFPLDFLVDFVSVTHLEPDESIVDNPPFVDEILQHVIHLDPIKAVLIWPFARLVAAWPWLSAAALAHVWMLTRRPAMPPGSQARGCPTLLDHLRAWLLRRACGRLGERERRHRGPADLGRRDETRRGPKLVPHKKHGQIWEPDLTIVAGALGGVWSVWGNVRSMRFPWLRQFGDEPGILPKPIFETNAAAGITN
jgi:hypothetical protein